MHTAQFSFHKNFFTSQKKLKLFILYPPWLLGKTNQASCFSVICYVIKTKKTKTRVGMAGTEFRYIFRIYFNGFSKHALATSCIMPDLSGH